MKKEVAQPFSFLEKKNPGEKEKESGCAAIMRLMKRQVKI